MEDGRGKREEEKDGEAKNSKFGVQPPFQSTDSMRMVPFMLTTVRHKTA